MKFKSGISLKRIGIYSLTQWAFMIWLLINCHSVYEESVNEIHSEVICCILLLLLVLSGGKRFKRESISLIILYLIYQVPLLIYSFLGSNTEYLSTYIVKYVLFVVATYLAIAQNEKLLDDLMDKFIRIIELISVVSLFFYTFGTALHVIGPTGRARVFWGVEKLINSYFGIYFETSIGRLFSYENSAIFIESPIWAALICFALTYELFYFDRRFNRGRIILLYITLITTFTTTGVIFILLSMFGILYKWYSRIRSSRKLKALVGIGIAGGVILGAVLIALVLRNKSMSGYSFMMRADDLLVGFRALKEHPLMGVGFGNTEYRMQYYSHARIQHGRLGQSSDFASVLASGGLYFFVFYVLGFAGIQKARKGNRGTIVLMFLLIYVFIISRVGGTLFFLQAIVCGNYYFMSGILRRRKEEISVKEENLYCNFP